MRGTASRGACAPVTTIASALAFAESFAAGCPENKQNLFRKAASCFESRSDRSQILGWWSQRFLREVEAIRQILIDYWMGHSNPSMGDRYGKQLVEDINYRQDQIKKAGLGFELPESLFGLRGLQILDATAAA
jgi:hypothetical protein